MTGLDTNVLVRFFVRDDTGQADIASARIKNIVSGGGSCHVNVVVICELVWVLESAYGYRRQEIADLLEKMLATRQLDIEAKDIVRQAALDYRRGRADMADYLIGRINHFHGCSRTITFDKALKNTGLFDVLS
jgi:predicted nucleic-acid-binding protein